MSSVGVSRAFSDLIGSNRSSSDISPKISTPVYLKPILQFTYLTNFRMLDIGSTGISSCTFTGWISSMYAQWPFAVNYYDSEYTDYHFKSDKIRLTLGQELADNNNMISQEILNQIYQNVEKLHRDTPVLNIIMTGWAREAENKNDIQDLIARIRCDLKIEHIQIIDQEKEAHYAYRAACLSLREKELVSADSGGKSTQFSFGDLTFSIQGISSTDIGNKFTNSGSTSPNPVDLSKAIDTIAFVQERVMKVPGYLEFRDKIKDKKIVGFGLFSYLRDYLNILGFETKVLTRALTMDAICLLMNKTDQEIQNILGLKTVQESKNRVTNFCMIYAVLMALDIDRVDFTEIPSSFGPIC